MRFSIGAEDLGFWTNDPAGEHLVEPGEIPPDDVHTPGVFVQRVVPLTEEQVAAKQIEKRTTRPRPTAEGASS